MPLELAELSKTKFGERIRRIRALLRRSHYAAAVWATLPTCGHWAPGVTTAEIVSAIRHADKNSIDATRVEQLIVQLQNAGVNIDRTDVMGWRWVKDPGAAYEGVLLDEFYRKYLKWKDDTACAAT